MESGGSESIPHPVELVYEEGVVNDQSARCGLRRPGGSSSCQVIYYWATKENMTSTDSSRILDGD